MLTTHACNTWHYISCAQITSIVINPVPGNYVKFTFEVGLLGRFARSVIFTFFQKHKNGWPVQYWHEAAVTLSNINVIHWIWQALCEISNIPTDKRASGASKDPTLIPWAFTTNWGMICFSFRSGKLSKPYDLLCRLMRFYFIPAADIIEHMAFRNSNWHKKIIGQKEG